VTPKLAVDAQVRHDIIVGVRKAELGHPITELTPAQDETLDLIRTFVAVHGYSPSLRQVADGTGCALSTASYRLAALVARGYLRRELGAARTLVLVDRRPKATPAADPCSVCGRS
jgi:repressor LexA